MNKPIQKQAFTVLYHFFTCYFHEDWKCFAKSIEGQTANFCKDEPLDRVRQLIRALESLRDASPSDTELLALLYEDLAIHGLNFETADAARACLCRLLMILKKHARLAARSARKK
jgi:hypothetical protein